MALLREASSNYRLSPTIILIGAALFPCQVRSGVNSPAPTSPLVVYKSTASNASPSRSRSFLVNCGQLAVDAGKFCACSNSTISFAAPTVCSSDPCSVFTQISAGKIPTDSGETPQSLTVNLALAQASYKLLASTCGSVPTSHIKISTLCGPSRSSPATRLFGFGIDRHSDFDISVLTAKSSAATFASSAATFSSREAMVTAACMAAGTSSPNPKIKTRAANTFHRFLDSSVPFIFNRSMADSIATPVKTQTTDTISQYVQTKVASEVITAAQPKNNNTSKAPNSSRAFGGLETFLACHRIATLAVIALMVVRLRRIGTNYAKNRSRNTTGISISASSFRVARRRPYSIQRKILLLGMILSPPPTFEYFRFGLDSNFAFRVSNFRSSPLPLSNHESPRDDVVQTLFLFGHADHDETDVENIGEKFREVPAGRAAEGDAVAA